MHPYEALCGRYRIGGLLQMQRPFMRRVSAIRTRRVLPGLPMALGFDRKASKNTLKLHVIEVCCARFGAGLLWH